MATWAYITPEILTWARRASGLTRLRIANKVHVRVEKLRLWESGTKRPTWDQALRLAKILGIPFGMFYLSAEMIPKLNAKLNTPQKW